jgi:hypothetical protein
MRLWNPTYTNIDITTKANRRTIYKTDVHGNMHTYVEIFYTGASNANATEVGGAADSAKDGTATPFKINIVSSDANDTDATTGDARKVRLIGISVPATSADSTIAAATGTVDPNWANGKEEYTVEELNLAGATDVYSQRFWIHVMHAYCSDWGSGGADAKGNITVESPANTTLLTIAAGANESNASAIYGCYGYSGRLTYLKAGADDVAFNNT